MIVVLQCVKEIGLCNFTSVSKCKCEREMSMAKDVGDTRFA